MADGLFSLTPEMVRQQQRLQDIQLGQQRSQGMGLFAPLAAQGFAQQQRLNRGLAGNEQVKQAEDFQRIKQEALSNHTPGSVAYHMAVRNGLQAAGYPDVAAQAQQKINELTAQKRKAIIEQQELGLKTRKQELEEAKFIRQAQKPLQEFGNEIEAAARGLFGKNAEQLNPQEFQAVRQDIQQRKLQRANASRTQITNILEEKGNEALAKNVGQLVFDDVIKQDGIRANITRLENLSERVRNQNLITGGGATVQQIKQGAAAVFGDMGWLTPGQLDALENTEDVRAELNKLVFDTLGGLGAQVSEGDRDFIVAAIGSLGNTPGGLIKVFNRVRDILVKEDQAISRRVGLADKVISGGGIGAVAAERAVVKEYKDLEPLRQPAPQTQGVERTTSTGVKYRIIEE